MTAAATATAGSAGRHRRAAITGPLVDLLRRPTVLLSVAFLVFMVVCAFGWPWIAPYDPNAQDLQNPLAPPLSTGHLLGTDSLGRDVLSRLLQACAVALQTCTIPVFIAVSVGVPIGLVAGYFGGGVDQVASRAVDAFQALPALFVALALIAAIGPGLTNALVAIGLVFIPSIVRVTRARVLEVRSEPYVEASRVTGASTVSILSRRILPNIFHTVLVQATLVASFALLAEASLSFLGFGVEPPGGSWGSMMRDGYRLLRVQPWLSILPGLAISLAVLSIQILGDSIRTVTGPGPQR